MVGTSVTVVLIGAETYTRKWVLYEIRESHKQNKGLLGIRMTGMTERDQTIDWSVGQDPFSYANLVDAYGRPMTYPIYNWVSDNGRLNLGSWVEAAARAKGR